MRFDAASGLPRVGQRNTGKALRRRDIPCLQKPSHSVTHAERHHRADQRPQPPGCRRRRPGGAARDRAAPAQELSPTASRRPPPCIKSDRKSTRARRGEQRVKRGTRPQRTLSCWKPAAPYTWSNTPALHIQDWSNACPIARCLSLNHLLFTTTKMNMPLRKISNITLINKDISPDNTIWELW